MDKIEIDLLPSYSEAEFLRERKKYLFMTGGDELFENWLRDWRKREWNNGPRFSWVNKNGKKLEMHTPTYDCRDHMCDWLNYPNQKKKERAQLLGHTSCYPVNTDKTRLLIGFEGNMLADAFVENFEFLHLQEEQFFPKAEKSKLFEVHGSKVKRMFYIEGDPIFAKSSVTNSFYTLMLRAIPDLKKKRPSLSQLQKHLDGRDGKYLRDAEAAVEDLEAYVGALKDIDFSETHMPYGGVTDHQYSHSVGGFVWMAHYLRRATTDPRFINVYGNQICEKVIGKKVTKHRNNHGVCEHVGAAKSQYATGNPEAQPYLW